jgi:hypothetical protein
MVVGGRVVLVCGAAAAALLMGGLGGAHGAANCQEIVKQKPQGMFTQYCGPARAVAVVHGTTYRFTHGSCEVSLDKKVRVFSLQVGYVQDSWTGLPTVYAVYLRIRQYAGPGTYSTNERAGISVRVAKKLWNTTPATLTYKKLGAYRGAGSVTVKAGETGGSFAAPVPEHVGPNGDLHSSPTIRISGSFTCR